MRASFVGESCARQAEHVAPQHLNLRARPRELRGVIDAVVLVEAEGVLSGRPALHVPKLDAGVIVRCRRDDRKAIGILCDVASTWHAGVGATAVHAGNARAHDGARMRVLVGDAPGA